MLAGWTRVSVWVAVGALLANVQCYGNCGTAACKAAQMPLGGCPHHKSSHDGQVGCLHQHSEFIGTESDVANASVAKTTPIVSVLTSCSTAVLLESVLLLRAHTGSPPHNHAFTAVSVLRI
jgi:hypothetical protein